MSSKMNKFNKMGRFTISIILLVNNSYLKYLGIKCYFDILSTNQICMYRKRIMKHFNEFFIIILFIVTFDMIIDRVFNWYHIKINYRGITITDKRQLVVILQQSLPTVQTDQYESFITLDISFDKSFLRNTSNVID